MGVQELSAAYPRSVSAGASFHTRSWREKETRSLSASRHRDRTQNSGRARCFLEATNGDVMQSDYRTLTKKDAEFQRLVRREELILDVTETLAGALQEVKMNRSQLANKLGRTRGFVSQLFAGGRNLTLGTISDVALAIGFKPRLKLCAQDDWAQYTVESFNVSAWNDLTERSNIVLHPSSYTTDDREEMIA